MIAQTISDDAGHPINDEVGNGAVAGVFDLAQVFQFVEDGFDQRPPAQEVSPQRG